ncbi:MAG: hypothetical protein QM790_03420 [Nibricoccus sp.]
MKVYLGTDAAGGFQPIGCEERLKRAYRFDHAKRLQEIERYLEEDHTPDWSKHDLIQAGNFVADVLKKKFPELEDVVVRSLANRFTFGWK